MTLPYTWRPEGTRSVNLKDLLSGMLVAYEHEVWRVIAIHELDPVDVEPGRPTRTVQLRPVGSVSIMTSSDEDVHLSGFYFDVFMSEHYPVCVRCLKPLPCPEQMAERTVLSETRRARRYEMPGTCPACEEPVTEQQARQTWPDNLVVPNGQPVTFHLRKRCVSSAVRYDEKWRAAGHESLLGFEPDATAVEKMLAQLDGRDDWGKVADTRAMRRYASQIPPKVNSRPGDCSYKLEGCLGKRTHTGSCNGLAMTSGCETCMAKWVEDPDAALREVSTTRATCPSAHLHVQHLTPAQQRIGLKAVTCGCRRGVRRLASPVAVDENQQH